MATSPPTQTYCLITGVSPGGLGDALTTELLTRPNMHMIATGLELNHLDHIATSSSRVTKLQLDVTSPSSISSAVEAVERLTSGRLDYLVNNAGYGYMMPLLDAQVDAVRDNFEVNVFGLLAVTQAFFPLIRAAQGWVVNQCSIASLVGGRQPYIGSYCATKAAVASLNDHMRLEFAPFGVKVVGYRLANAWSWGMLRADNVRAGRQSGRRRRRYRVLESRAGGEDGSSGLFAVRPDRCSCRADDEGRDKPTWSTFS